jgi:hypothetical protein
MSDNYVVDLGNGEEYFAEDRDTVYCKHGKYIGYPGGPDYICPFCEDGADTLAHGLRYNIDVNWRPDLEEGSYSTVIRCWGPSQLQDNLGTLRFLFQAALKGTIEVRIVVIRYAFWTNIHQEEEVPEPFFYFYQDTPEEVIY